MAAARGPEFCIALPLQQAGAWGLRCCVGVVGQLQQRRVLWEGSGFSKEAVSSLGFRARVESALKGAGQAR